MTEITEKKSPPIRPARRAEIAQAHAWLEQAIDTSPYYGSAFKAFEKQQLSLHYLQRLYDLDPGHIMMMVDGDVPKGIMISSPQYGALWLHWSFLPPENRRGSLAMAATRALINYWDNGRFHKISTYTKPDNTAAKTIMHRYGYKQIAVLEQHLFGEDYLLYEHTLTKVSEGYDFGVPGEGTLGRLKRRARRLLGL